MFEVTLSLCRYAKAILVHARGAACAHAHAHASACACVGFVRPSCLVFDLRRRRQREAATSLNSWEENGSIRVRPAVRHFPSGSESCAHYPPFFFFWRNQGVNGKHSNRAACHHASHDKRWRCMPIARTNNRFLMSARFTWRLSDFGNT